MIIAVDFDGTCVTHDFPNVGKEIGAAPVLKKLVEKGHQIILFTMRSHKLEGAADDEALGYGETRPHTFERSVLQDAVDWFKSHDIPLFGINENPTQKTWTSSPKPYAHMYIDDLALGAPLDFELSDKPYIDWPKVEDWFISLGIL